LVNILPLKKTRFPANTDRTTPIFEKIREETDSSALHASTTTSHSLQKFQTHVQYDELGPGSEYLLEKESHQNDMADDLVHGGLDTAKPVGPVDVVYVDQ
jgi:hypothetical protein